MRIECLTARADALPEQYLSPRAGLTSAKVFQALTPGKEYIVYAIGWRKGGLQFYVSDDDNLSYPHGYPAPLFRITDNSLSSQFRLVHWPDHEDYEVLISFPEWVNDPYFYDRLTDGSIQEVQVFARYKRL